MDSKGNVILSELTYEVSDDDITYAIVKHKEDSKDVYTIYSYNGKDMATFPVSSDDDVKNPRSSSEDDYISVYYNKVNYIIDIQKTKLLMSFNDDNQFCISSVNPEKHNEFTIESCTSTYSYLNSEDEKYISKFIRGDKVLFTKTNDNYSRLFFIGDTLIYTSYDDHYDSTNSILNDEGKEIADIKNTQYRNSKNYAIELEDDGGVDIYINNEKKAHFKCSISSGNIDYDIFTLEECKDSGFGENLYVNFNGEVINKAIYKYAGKYDENGYAAVSVDGENYQLINKDGETVSGIFKSPNIIYVPYTKNIYYGITKDSEDNVKHIIFKVGGDVIVTGDDLVEGAYLKKKFYLILKKGDDDYMLYALSDQKELGIFDTKPQGYEKYFTITKNDKIQYYSYLTGKVFYEKNDD